MNKLKTVFEKKVADKDKILNSILANEEKINRKIKYIKIIKIASISFTTIIGIMAFLSILSKNINNPNKIESYAKSNDIVTNNDPNSNQYQDNLENKYFDYTEDQTNIKPYKIISIDTSLAYDITDLNKLYQNVDIVVSGKVIEKNKAEKTSIQPIAYTPGVLQISNIIKGNIDIKNVKFLVPGGKITIEEYENSIKNNFADKFKQEGLDKLSPSFKKENYIQYNYEYSNNFYINTDYVMFLNKVENTDQYVVISYVGMIPVKDSTAIKSKADVFSLDKVQKDNK